MKTDERLQVAISKGTDAALPAVWQALIKKCVKGDVQAIRLFFDMKGLNPATALQRELGKERLEIERQRLKQVVSLGDAIANNNERVILLAGLLNSPVPDRCIEDFEEDDHDKER